MRDLVPGHLHPTFRDLSADLSHRIAAAKLPIQPYEGWRDPNRQVELYAFGRASGVGVPGRHKTFERAWESSHQHGMAEDWVWWVNGQWSWAPPPGYTWDEFHEHVDAVGLVRLKFEEPHVQMPGFNARKILAGAATYPAGGDEEWEANIEAAALAWGLLEKKDRYGLVQPGAPHILVSGQRPAIPVPDGMVYDEERGLCYPEPDVPESSPGS